MTLKTSVVIHQPHFLPWPPYLAKLALAKVFVVQDDVLYRKLYFHNRTRILNDRRQPLWVSLPVHANSTTLIREAVIDLSKGRLVRHISNVIGSAYRDAPNYSRISPPLRSFLSSIGSTPDMAFLSRINVASLVLLLNLLEIPAPEIVYSSQLGITSTTRTERLIEIIQKVGAEDYLTGWGESLNPAVHDLGLILDSGIRILAFDKPTTDCSAPYFTTLAGLSTVHWLFEMPQADLKTALLSYSGALTVVTGA